MSTGAAYFKFLIQFRLFKQRIFVKFFNLKNIKNQ
jgi:hypothetical protein